MRFVGIDPSSKTGFVALDENGDVLRAKELTGVGAKDPKRMVTLIDEIIAHIEPNDCIAMEGFSFGSKGRGIAFQYGLGHGIRMALYRRGISFQDIAPNAVKKFATGKGNTKKENMILPIYNKWSFESPSDNVRDGYVLAQISRALSPDIEMQVTKYQSEVLQAIRKG